MPTFDAFSASDTGTTNIDVEFAVDFTASATGADLATMIFELTDLTTGEVESNSTAFLSGQQDSGSVILRAPGDRGNGHSYEVWAEVTDVEGNNQQVTLTVSEGGSASIGNGNGNGGGNGNGNGNGNGGGDGGIDMQTIALAVGVWWAWKKFG